MWSALSSVTHFKVTSPMIRQIVFRVGRLQAGPLYYLSQVVSVIRPRPEPRYQPQRSLTSKPFRHPDLIAVLFTPGDRVWTADRQPAAAELLRRVF